MSAATLQGWVSCEESKSLYLSLSGTHLRALSFVVLFVSSF